MAALIKILFKNRYADIKELRSVHKRLCIMNLQSFTKILRLHRFSAPSPDKAMLLVWWEDFLEWKWSFGNNIAL